ncbi:hypothetical protein Kisp01_70270 [Kineosporia sp. NBRC 101677]|uniref:DUF397 domain-containing protein n=1 Tax=Kineosporia sp. NBRC 101677 TaxID=3032197 RepID=UPI0024A482F9|nr:DUF397 domain-containing protein [Kineosporia sp. NBRC 101677]GLY20013.1 hypothetical protein Kisp01_70270 [Kineosporia sp. NBRC 101677]
MITEWQKSKKSGGSGNCVEQRRNGLHRQIRDSKNPEGAILTVRASAYAALIEAAQDGELDNLAD